MSVETDSLVINPDTLYLFLDESGHHETNNSAHPAFCIAGCALPGSIIDDIDTKWKELMKDCFGDENFIFHATSDQVKNAGQNTHQKIFDYFKDNSFSRFAVGYHGKTVIDDKSKRYAVMAKLLQERGFFEIIKWLPFNSIAFVYEDCERDREIIEENFGGMHVEENGVEIPVDFYFLPKSSGFSALGIADALANTAYREVKRRFSGGGTFGYDFKEIFKSVDSKQVYFMSIEEIKSE